MSGWSETRLRYVADLNPSIRQDILANLDAELSFLPMEAIGEDGSIDIERTRPVSEVRNGYSYFADGDVAFAKVTPCFENGKGALMHGLTGGAGFGTTEITVLRPKPGTNPRYLNYVLKGEKFRQFGVGAMTGAGGLKRVPDEFTRDFHTPWPNPTLQERIANFLDDKTTRIDALIAEKERLASAMREFRESKVRQLACKGTRPSPMRSTHVNWLKEVPKHWTVPRIKHVARMESGHTPDKKVAAYWQDCTIPWVSLNDTGQLLTTDYIQDTAVSVNELGIQNSSARILPEGTVFFSRDATIGRCGIAARPMACSQHFIGWICSEEILPEYLLIVLRSMGDELERLTMGATLKTIGMVDVRTLSIPLPPLQEQAEIVVAVGKLKAQTESIELVTIAFIQLLREYRSSLISAAVTGQLDISSLEKH